MIIEVVGAVIRDGAGRLLTVRKRGTERFMLPGGKPEAGETEAAALARELWEELGVRVAEARPLGRFEAPAANESGATVRSSAYLVEITGKFVPGAEIEEILWLDLSRPPAVPLAHMLADRVIPALAAAR